MYYYREGYLRTSSEAYTLGKLSENFIHLTNNCLQQFNKNYGTFEEGNTLSFDVFRSLLKTDYNNLVDFDKDLLPRMKDLMIDSFLSTKSEINIKRRKFCFEMLGFDFLIDEDFRVWLIEVKLFR